MTQTKYIQGAGGSAGGGGFGKSGGGGSSRSPRTTPDSLDSRQYATVVDLISEGEIEGLVDGNKGIFLNGTALQTLKGVLTLKTLRYTREMAPRRKLLSQLRLAQRIYGQ